MRGIAGIISFEQRPVAAGAIEELLAQLSRGTFERVTHASLGGAAFGHVLRVSVPEDRGETQPLRSADGNLLLVTDALLENRAELAASFGWSPGEAAARADSAFVLAAYEKWGEACPAQLEGRWALAIWHARERRLFAAVDAFSFRPFYYVAREGFFALASTLRGLLALPEVSRELHEGVLADWLRMARSHPGQTLYREIKALPAAHRLRADGARVTVERYWQADPAHELQLGSEADYVAAFSAELERAVSAGLRVAGNVGIMLSGGLDSAAATAVAGRLLAAQGRRLQAIHRLPPEGGPRFAPGRELDESAHVRRMQAHLPHVDFHFLPPAAPGTSVDLAAWDTLFGDHCVPLRSVPMTRAEPADPPLRALALNRVFTGHGGNYAVSLEAYPNEYFLQLATRGQWVRLARELRGHAAFYRRTIRHLVKYRLLRPLLRGHERARAPDAALLAYLQPDFVRRTGLDAPAQGQGFPPWTRADFDVKRRLAATINELMPQNTGAGESVIAPFARGDNYAPFLTRRLNAFCLSVPLDQQIRDGRDRLLLRRAMQGLLPDEVIWRTSRGFDAPDAWAVARPLVAALPAALDELEHSALAARTLNLPKLRRDFAEKKEAELQRLGPTRLLHLFSLAWFLRWAERCRS